jgi:RNA polymerase sigma factor (sigma-70 family)
MMHPATGTTVHAETIERLRRRAAGLAQTIVGDPGTADDVAAQALDVAFAKAPRPVDADLWPWLARVVVNLARTARRTERRRQGRFVSGDAGGQSGESSTGWGAIPAPALSDPALAAVDAESRRRIFAALDALPEAERDAIILVRLADVPVAEAAEQLGLSPAGVRTRISRGTRRLRAALSPATGLSAAFMPIVALLGRIVEWGRTGGRSTVPAGAGTLVASLTTQTGVAVIMSATTKLTIAAAVAVVVAAVAIGIGVGGDGAATPSLNVALTQEAQSPTTVDPTSGTPLPPDRVDGDSSHADPDAGTTSRTTPPVGDDAFATIVFEPPAAAAEPTRLNVVLSDLAVPPPPPGDADAPGEPIDGIEFRRSAMTWSRRIADHPGAEPLRLDEAPATPTISIVAFDPASGLGAVVHRRPIGAGDRLRVPLIRFPIVRATLTDDAGKPVDAEVADQTRVFISTTDADPISTQRKSPARAAWENAVQTIEFRVSEQLGLAKPERIDGPGSVWRTRHPGRAHGWAVAYAPGYLDGPMVGFEAGATDREVVITLGPAAASVAGTLTIDGRPAPPDAALVSGIHEHAGPRTDGGVIQRLADLAPPVPVTDADRSMAARAGTYDPATGRYRLTNFAAGTLHLHLRAADGRQSAIARVETAPGEEAQLDLAITPHDKYAVRVRVITGDGTSLPEGVAVAWAPGRHNGPIGAGAQAVSNGETTLRLPLGAVPATITASARGFVAAPQTIDPRTTGEVTITLIPGAELDVRVLDTSGEPVGNVEVRLLRLDGTQLGGWARTSPTGEAARFGHLPAGEVIAMAPGVPPQRVRVTSGDTQRVDLRADGDAVRVTLQLVDDASGAPVAGRPLMILAPGIRIGAGESDADGRFEASLSPGRYSVVVVEPRTLSAMVHPIVVETGPTTITVPAAGRLTIEAVDPAGKPVAATFAARPLAELDPGVGEPRTTLPVIVSDRPVRDGRLMGLPSPTRPLEVFAHSEAGALGRAEVAAGARRVRITLRPAGTVRLTLRGDGLAAEGDRRRATLQVLDADTGRPIRDVALGIVWLHDRTTTLVGLEPGPVRIDVVVPGIGRAVVAATVRAGSTPEAPQEIEAVVRPTTPVRLRFPTPAISGLTLLRSPDEAGGTALPVTLRAYRLEPEGLLAVPTGDGGCGRDVPLVPGRYTVRARAGDGRLLTATVEVPEASGGTGQSPIDVIVG